MSVFPVVLTWYWEYYVSLDLLLKNINSWREKNTLGSLESLLYTNKLILCKPNKKLCVTSTAGFVFQLSIKLSSQSKLQAQPQAQTHPT